MRILIATEGFGQSLYGVTQVVRRIAERLAMAGQEVIVLATSVKDIPKEVDYRMVSSPQSLAGSKSQISFLRNAISEYAPEVVHVHGCFRGIQKSAVLAAKRHGVPVLLSPHGMLEPWLWKQKGRLYEWAKRAWWNVLLKPHLSKVDYVHAITRQEAETLRREFPGISQIRIPNAVEIGEFPQEPADPYDYLLFLGRIHPKKGVDLLIRAYAEAKLKRPLLIAGPCFDARYQAMLEKMVAELRLEDRIRFLGPVYGEEKLRLLARAWCTVVPSYSEVVALVNLESAACFTPTITTTETGLDDWEEGGGLLVAPRVQALAEALSRVDRWSVAERKRWGEKARRFVEEWYSWEVVGKMWLEAYERIANTGRE